MGKYRFTKSFWDFLVLSFNTFLSTLSIHFERFFLIKTRLKIYCFSCEEKFVWQKIIHLLFFSSVQRGRKSWHNPTTFLNIKNGLVQRRIQQNILHLRVDVARWSSSLTSQIIYRSLMRSSKSCGSRLMALIVFIDKE